MLIRVSIVEDDKAYREAISTILQGTPGFKLVSAHPSAAHALAHLPAREVDVALVDLSLRPGGLDGIECIRRLREKRLELLLCALTVHEDTDRIFNSLKAGAKGYILKKSPPAALLEGLVELANGGSPMSPAIARKVTQHFHEQRNTSDRVDGLTDRELEVLDLVARGMMDKEIGVQLGISVHTVRNHVRSIYDKLNVHSRVEATTRYLRPTTRRGRL